MLTTEEKIEREKECIEYLMYLMNKSIDTNKYKEAMGYLNSIRFSLEELEKLEQRKQSEEHFKNLLKRSGVQIHHVLHVMQIKK